MRRIIAIVSGKGGVGKTVTTLNLSMALHELDEHVLTVDGDLNNPNVGLYLGLYNFPTTLNDVLENEINLLEALHIHESGLRIIPSSLSLQHLNTDINRMDEVFKQTEGYTLIDCAPGFGKEVISSIEACDEVLAVTNPITPSVVGCMRLIEIAKEMDKEIRGIVLNRLGANEVEPKEIEAVCDVPIIGEIPYDKHVDKSIIAKNPLVKQRPLSPASVSFKQIAHELIGREFEPPSFLKLRRFLNKFSLKRK